MRVAEGSRTERLKEIGDLIFTAGNAFKDADWSRTSPEISAAEHALNEAMADYVDGNTSKANVRTVYQRWRDLHKTGAMV